MKFKYMGEMNFKDAVKKYGKKLPDINELQKIPKKVLQQSKDNDAWGIILDKEGKINKLSVYRWPDGNYYGVDLDDCNVSRGVFIVEEEKKRDEE